MKTDFYCRKCGKKVNTDILELQEKSGKRFAKGECPNCKNNLSVIIPNSLDIEYDNNSEIKRLKEEIEKNERKIEDEISKLKEKKEVETFVEEVDKNPILKKHNIVAIKKSNYRFWKVMGILFFLFLLVMAGLLVFTGYKVYQNRFDLKGLVSPVFNNDVSNNYDFKPSTTNSYKNEIDARDYNNITVNVKLCNGTTPC